MHSTRHGIAWVAVLLGLASCTRNAPHLSDTPHASPFLPKASIREIMDAEVDPAADGLWESVVFTLSAAGAEEKQPRTPEEWKAIRRHAITLIEATNLLMMEGRHVAPADTPLAPGEDSITVRQQRLDSNRAAFNGFAQALQGIGIKALDAIDAQDAARLLEVGGEIDEACEACHLVYWYPQDSRPQG